MTDPQVVKYQFRVDRELLDRAKARAREQDLTVAQVLRWSLRRYVRGEAEMIRGRGNHEE
jgi:antitoxin component of RelBE/YafQ-DinJ toxin-antitoxin module